MGKEFIDELKDQVTLLLEFGVMNQPNTAMIRRWFTSQLNSFLTDMSSREVIRDYIVHVVDAKGFEAEVFFRYGPAENFRRLRVSVKLGTVDLRYA